MASLPAQPRFLPTQRQISDRVSHYPSRKGSKGGGGAGAGGAAEVAGGHQDRGTGGHRPLAQD